jgi:hypothetical protein
MHLYLLTIQPFAFGFALVIVAIVALTELLEFRRKDRPPLVGHHSSKFERDHNRRSFTTEPDE